MMAITASSCQPIITACTLPDRPLSVVYRVLSRYGGINDIIPIDKMYGLSGYSWRPHIHSTVRNSVPTIITAVALRLSAAVTGSPAPAHLSFRPANIFISPLESAAGVVDDCG